MKNIHSQRHVLSMRENAEAGQLRKAEMLAAEIEEGNNEYKFKLTNLSEDQFTHRITQLNWRLNEGNDEAVYEIGVEDDGNPLGLSSDDLNESLLNLKRMADTVGCCMSVQQFLKGEVGITAKVLLKRTERLRVTPVQVQVAVAGPADTGKSTLIAVLSSGSALDNGKGLARTQVFRHNHEVKSGRTSSNTQHNLYFGATGNVLNSDTEGCNTGNGKGCSNRLRSRSDMELADETCRIISFIDLAGSSKYLKTTLHGIVGHSPDHFILVISARKGMEQMTSEFLGLCFALQLNLIIVLTKIDTVSSVVTSNLVDGLTKMLNRAGNGTVSERKAISIDFDEQLDNLRLDSVQLLHSRGESSVRPIPIVVPIFKVSSVTGEGLGLLRSHLFQLPNHTRSWTEARAQLTQVRIIGSFEKRDEKHVGNDTEECETSAPFTSSAGLFSEDNVDHSSHISVPDEKKSPQPSNEYMNHVSTAPQKCTTIDSRLSSKISDSDATSIASLWTEISSSPSPPPPAIPSPEPKVVAPRYIKSTSAALASPTAEHDRELAPDISINDESNEISFEAGSKVSELWTDKSFPSSNLEENLSKVVASSFMGPDTVLFGQILSGVLTQGDRLVLGPIGTDGAFALCSIQSIRVNDVPVKSAVAGQTATMVLKSEVQEIVEVACRSACTETSSMTAGHLSTEVPRSSSISLNSLSSDVTSVSSATIDSSDSIRINNSVSRVKASLCQGPGQAVSTGTSVSAGSGLVLLSPEFNPIAYWEFEAEVLIINHPGKVRVSYEPVVHFLGCCVRQSARIIGIKKIVLLPSKGVQSPNVTDDTASNEGEESKSDVALVTGDKAICRFRFLYRPEYISLSSTSDNAMVMREGRTKGVGKVLSLSCPSSAGLLAAECIPRRDQSANV